MAKKFIDIRKTFRLRSEDENRAYREKFLAAPPHWSHSDFIRFAVLGCQPPRTRKPRPVKDYKILAQILGNLAYLNNNVNQLAMRANMGAWPESQKLKDACSHIREMRDMLRISLGYQPRSSDKENPSP